MADMPLTAAIMMDAGGEEPAYCLMVAYRSKAQAVAALDRLSHAPLTPGQVDDAITACATHGATLEQGQQITWMRRGEIEKLCRHVWRMAQHGVTE